MAVNVHFWAKLEMIRRTGVKVVVIDPAPVEALSANAGSPKACRRPTCTTSASISAWCSTATSAARSGSTSPSSVRRSTRWRGSRRCAGRWIEPSIALGIGWGTLVAAELIAATRGIGHFIMSASQFLATDFVFFSIESSPIPARFSRLANSLGVELIKAEALRAESERPDNPDAVDLAAMRGWAKLNGSASKAALDAAAALFERALSLDANNVRAMIGLAGALTWRVNQFWSADPGGDIARAEKAIDAALALQPGNWSAHGWKSRLLYAKRQWGPAIAEAETAIALDHNDAGAGRQHPRRALAHRPRVGHFLPEALISLLVDEIAGHCLEAEDEARSGVRRVAGGSP